MLKPIITISEPELYHLGDDIAEQHNLIASQPDKTRELQAAYDAWNKDNAPAINTRNPKPDPKKQ